MLLVRRTLAKGENGGFVLRDNPKDPLRARRLPRHPRALAAARDAQRE